MRLAISQHVMHAYLNVIHSNIVCITKALVLFQVLAKPFAKRNKRKQDLIEQISENTIHQIVIVYIQIATSPYEFFET